MFKFWRVIKKVIFNWLLLPLFMYSQHNIVFFSPNIPIALTLKKNCVNYLVIQLVAV